MIHVGVVMSAPWVGAFIWTLVASCMRREANRRGLRLSYLAAIDLPHQVLLLNELLDQEVDALVFLPMSTTDADLMAALDRAHAAKIPVISLDSYVDHVAVSCTVGSDNDAAQALITRLALDAVNRRGTVLRFRGDSRLPSGRTRNESFERILSEYPEVRIIQEAELDWVAAASGIELGARTMRALLDSGCQPDVIVSANDEAAIGALQVISEARLARKVVVAGFDGLAEALLAIRDGAMLATMKQVPEAIAKSAFDAAEAAVHLVTLPRFVPVPTVLVTLENVMETALDALRLVPQFVVDLSHGQHLQRELQQAVIEKQQKILNTVSAVSNVLGRVREPVQMMHDLVDMLCDNFKLSAVVAVPSPDSLLFERYERSVDVPDNELKLHRAVSLPLTTSGKLLGELVLNGPTDALDSQNLAVFEAIANQVAIALHNANLYSQTVRLAESQLRETEEKLVIARQAEHQSYHDSLTSLPNRRMLSRRIDEAIGRCHRDRSVIALLFLDLDRFKQVNDIMGHEAGDKLLKEAAQRLLSCTLDNDLVARLGGDEFVVMRPDLSDREDAATLAKKILQSIGAPFYIGGQQFSVTASVGIALFPEDAGDESALMKSADIAMYHAKKKGKNNFQFYSANLIANSLERLALEAALRHALEQGQFRLYYQVKRETESRRISGMEVLLRWQHPDLGLVAPLQFLAIAEETGLIVPIGKWSIRAACLQNVAWQKEGLPHLVISINLTARQFNDETLVSDLVAILKETGMDPSLLELELAESTLLHDSVRTISTLAQLKREGLRIAIDDFGKGYSSVSTLRQFPLDTVKIDRSLIRGVNGDLNDENLAQAIIAMGRALSLTIVAQGVETREQADYLRKHACTEFQGFYFNKPLPPDRLAEILKAQTEGLRDSLL